MSKRTSSKSSPAPASPSPAAGRRSPRCRGGGSSLGTRAERAARRGWRWLGRALLGAGESHGRELDVMTQVGIAWRYRQAALLGALVGGAVPWFGRTIAHTYVPRYFHDGSVLRYPALAVTLGCLLFSMRSVYKFGCGAFGDATKAGWFVAALEGVMVVTDGATSDYALGLLVVINAVCNGCVMAVAQLRTAKRAADDARRQATRAANAAARRAAASVAAADVPVVPAAKAPATDPVTAWSSAARPPMGPTIYVAPSFSAPAVVSLRRAALSAGAVDADFS